MKTTTTFILATAGFVAMWTQTSCTTPAGADPNGAAYIKPPGQTPQEFLQSEQRPFLTQSPTQTQIQAATAGISVPAP